MFEEYTNILANMSNEIQPERDRSIRFIRPIRYEKLRKSKYKYVSLGEIVNIPSAQAHARA